MSYTIKILTIFAMFFLYFEGFVLPFGSNSYTFYYILVLFILFGFYTIFYFNNLKSKIKFLLTKTPYKYLFYFLSWLFIDSVILIITNTASILIFYYIIMKFIIPAVLCYFVSSIFVPKFISIKTSIKILITYYIFILLYGIFGYIGELFDISVIHNILNTFSNLKSLMCGLDSMTDHISGGARARGIFQEPGGFGKYILLFSPILYKCCFTKYKIYDNKILNLVVKKMTVPLSLLCLILTKSPIMLLFTLIFIFCYLFKHIILFIKKFFLGFMILTTLVFLIFYFGIDIQLKDSYLYRIVNTISSFNNFEMFIKVEPSLAARVVSYTNSFVLFLKKPIIGYGYDNVRFYMIKQYQISPLPLTEENFFMLMQAMNSEQGVGYNRSLLSGLLSETGLIGTFLYFLFLYRHIKYIDKLKPYFFGIERKFLEGLKISIILVIATSFYIYSFATAYLYLYYGFVCSFVTQYYINQRKGRYKQ